MEKHEKAVISGIIAVAIIAVVVITLYEPAPTEEAMAGEATTTITEEWDRDTDTSNVFVMGNDNILYRIDTVVRGVTDCVDSDGGADSSVVGEITQATHVNPPSPEFADLAAYIKSNDQYPDTDVCHGQKKAFLVEWACGNDLPLEYWQAPGDDPVYKDSLLMLVAQVGPTLKQKLPKMGTCSNGVVEWHKGFVRIYSYPSSARITNYQNMEYLGRSPLFGLVVDKGLFQVRASIQSQSIIGYEELIVQPSSLENSGLMPIPGYAFNRVDIILGSACDNDAQCDASAEETCQNGVCRCSDECEGGVRECLSDTTYRRCQYVDDDPCYEWRDMTCLSGQVCVDGDCVAPTMPPGCEECTIPGIEETFSPGDLACVPGLDVAVCVRRAGDLCNQWYNVDYCDEPTPTCENGACVCMNDCWWENQKECDGDVLKTCITDEDPDPCMEWGNEITCVNGCSNGEQENRYDAACIE
ncbi:hypothetical protein ACFL96_02940 [Thermoproteota archaeon]